MPDPITHSGAAAAAPPPDSTAPHRGATVAAPSLIALLAESLHAWRIAGAVSAEPDGTILVAAGALRLRIEPPPPGLPFRWMLASAERRRGVASLSGLLRALHAALDPGYAASRLRIAEPLLPPPPPPSRPAP